MASDPGPVKDVSENMSADVESLAEWSPWVPFAEALAQAPRLPGVYLDSEGAEGPIVYVGMGGERAGSGRPQGIRGRLRVYASGKALTSGLGEGTRDRPARDRRGTHQPAQLHSMDVRGGSRAEREPRAA